MHLTVCVYKYEINAQYIDIYYVNTNLDAIYRNHE